MLITPDFVMLNFPKTGSSYVRKVIKDVYRASENPFRKTMRRFCDMPEVVEELLFPKLEFEGDVNIPDQHGTLRQIPDRARDRPVASVFRNPLDRYVSAYLFEWWKNFPPASDEAIREILPAWPDLRFEDYLILLRHFSLPKRLGDIELRTELGSQTVHFIQFYFPNPADLLGRIDDAWIDSDAWKDEMPPITFLRQDSLSADLRDFLARMGIKEKWLQIVDQAERVNVTRRDEDEKDFNAFYSPELLDETLRRDRLLFRIFPEYLPKGMALPASGQPPTG